MFISLNSKGVIESQILSLYRKGNTVEVESLTHYAVLISIGTETGRHIS